QRLDRGIAGAQRAATPDRVEAQQRQTDIVAARSYLAGLVAGAGDERAGVRGRAVGAHRGPGVPDQPAVLCSRGPVLGDIAALLPIDPVELVEPGFEQDRFVEDEVAAAVGDAERQAQPVIGGKAGVRSVKQRRYPLRW